METVADGEAVEQILQVTRAPCGNRRGFRGRHARRIWGGHCGSGFNPMVRAAQGTVPNTALHAPPPVAPQLARVSAER